MRGTLKGRAVGERVRVRETDLEEIATCIDGRARGGK